MILVDTSVWVDHLRLGSNELSALLNRNEVVCHPFVIGEIACGHLRNRKEILTLLQHLPQLPVVDHDEVMGLLETRRLMGRGIGWIDAHLLASSLVTGSMLWTRDKRLASIASMTGLSS